jgi:hypothetical protein
MVHVTWDIAGDVLKLHLKSTGHDNRFVLGDECMVTGGEEAQVAMAFLQPDAAAECNRQQDWLCGGECKTSRISGRLRNAYMLRS